MTRRHEPQHTPTTPNHFGGNLGPHNLLPSNLLVSSQAGTACTGYSRWEIYESTPTCVDGPENDLISKPAALLVHILWRFGDGGLVLACCFLLRMMSQPGAQELLKGFSYLFLNTSCWQHFTLVPNALTFEMHPILPRI